MRINQAGIELIKEYEGFVAKSYLCPAGVWTIGYGHTKGVTPYTKPVTRQEAEQLLLEDVRDAENSVKRRVTVPLNENQFSALVSLVFNIGGTNFRTSTLLRLLNSGKYLEAANQFPRWNRGGGKVLAGLTRRREAERALFLKTD